MKPEAKPEKQTVPPVKKEKETVKPVLVYQPKQIQPVSEVATIGEPEGPLSDVKVAEPFVISQPPATGGALFGAMPAFKVLDPTLLSQPKWQKVIKTQETEEEKKE